MSVQRIDSAGAADVAFEAALKRELRRARFEPIAEHAARDLRSVSPLVRLVYYRVRHLEDERLEVFQAAERRVRYFQRQGLVDKPEGAGRRRPVRNLEQRRADGIAGGLAYVEVHGALHGPQAYEDWRKSDEAPADLASSAQIIKAFGKWSGFRAELELLPEFDQRTVGLAGLGAFITSREATHMLRACAKHAGYKAFPFETVYKPYARAQMALSVSERDCQRFALSAGPFRRIFGSWAEARAGAVVDLDLPDGRRALEGAEPGRKGEGRTCLDDTAYEREAYLEALREADRHHKPRRLTDRLYNERRTFLVHEARKRGEALPGLFSTSVRVRFGSFPDGLFQAGLISESERRLLLRSGGRPMCDEEVRASVELVAEQKGIFVSRRAYRRERDRLHLEAEDDELVIASDLTVAERFGGGGFDEAIRVLLRPHEAPGTRPKRQPGRPPKARAGAVAA